MNKEIKIKRAVKQSITKVMKDLNTPVTLYEYHPAPKNREVAMNKKVVIERLEDAIAGLKDDSIEIDEFIWKFENVRPHSPDPASTLSSSAGRQILIVRFHNCKEIPSQSLSDDGVYSISIVQDDPEWGRRRRRKSKMI